MNQTGQTPGFGSAGQTSDLALLLLLLLLLLCAPLLAAQQHSEELAFSPARYPASDLFFLDSARGWVVTADGLEGGQLFRTRDGGETWEGFSTGHAFNRVFFLTHDLGWALGWTSDDRKASENLTTWLFRSEDGGRTWKSVSKLLEWSRDEKDIIVDFLFTNPNRGFFALQKSGGAGVLLRTLDGGKTVLEVANLPERSRTANRIFVGGRGRHLWVFGKNSILYSSDEGESWSEQLAVLPGGLKEITLESGWFFDDGMGWAVGGSLGGIVLLTRDFGRHWTITLESKDSRFFTDVHFWDRAHGCIVGGSTLLHCTRDGGLTWTGERVLPRAQTDQSRFFENIFTHVAFTASGWGLTLSAGGHVYQTQDYGHTWRESDLPRISISPAPPPLTHGK